MHSDTKETLTDRQTLKGRSAWIFRAHGSLPQNGGENEKMGRDKQRSQDMGLCSCFHFSQATTT